MKEITCKEFYWHLINTQKHSQMGKQFPGFHDAVSTVWPRIFKLPFYIARDTKIQSFQFGILYIIIPCNKWFNTIKSKNILTNVTIVTVRR